MVDFYIVCAIVIAVSIFFLILTVKVIIDSERKKEFVFDEDSLEMITLYDWHLRRKSETIYNIKQAYKSKDMQRFRDQAKTLILNGVPPKYQFYLS